MRFQSRTSGLVVLLFTLIYAPQALAQLEVTGIVRAEEEVVLNSEFAGVVAEVMVDEGQRVDQGQLLVELRNQRQRIGVELARAGLAGAGALVEETEVLLANARRELERVRIAASSLPRKELEDIQDQVLRLEASLAAQIADRSRAEQEVLLSEQQLGETRLTAPFAGTVTEILIDRGDSLRPLETPVLELVELEKLYAEVLLPSSYVLRVRETQRVAVQIEGEWLGGAGLVEGTVTYVDPTIDAASRTFRVKVEIPSAEGRIRPGMLAEVRFR
jgi:RND family efflux transporter MFP subunit